MVTKSDIATLRKVIREEVSNESQTIRDELGSDITTSGFHLRDEISQLTDRIKNLEIRSTKNHNEVKKEIKQVLNFLDKDNMQTRKRVIRIEQHLGLNQ